MTHLVRGLRWAAPGQRPAGLPKARPRGAVAAGLRYERKLAKFLPDFAHGCWFEFIDSTGSHFCQPDLFLVLPERVLVLEVKLSWTMEAHIQLEGLYLPVLARAFGRRAVGAVVCRNLRPDCPFEVYPDLTAALSNGAVFHWLGTAAPASLGQGCPLPWPTVGGRVSSMGSSAHTL